MAAAAILRGDGERTAQFAEAERGAGDIFDTLAEGFGAGWGHEINCDARGGVEELCGRFRFPTPAVVVELATREFCLARPAKSNAWSNGNI